MNRAAEGAAGPPTSDPERLAVVAVGGNSLIIDPAHLVPALAGEAGTTIVPG